MNQVKVDKLSLKQISRLLNGHGVRVKLGNQQVMNLVTDSAKKLQKAYMKGSGVTIKLDPYSISKNLHLRGRGEVGNQMKQGAADDAVSIMDASTDRAIRGISAKGLQGKQLKSAATDNAINLMTASVDRAIRGISAKGIKKNVIGMGQVGDQMKQGAADDAVGIMDASTDRAIRGISAKGLQGKQLKSAATANAINLMTASVDRAIKGIKGNGRCKCCGGSMNPAGYGVSGVNKLKKFSSAIGDVLGLNSQAARDAKKQIIGAVGDAGSTYIRSKVPGSQFAPPAPTKPKGQPSYSPSDYTPTAYAIPIDQADALPAPKSSKPTDVYTPPDYGLPPLPDDNYYIPTGKLYASGVKRIPKHLRPKRILSEKQKAALAHGRSKLKQKLIEMGAGRGGAMYNAGYDQFNS
jgi:hypothetical protein